MAQSASRESTQSAVRDMKFRRDRKGSCEYECTEIKGDLSMLSDVMYSYTSERCGNPVIGS